MARGESASGPGHPAPAFIIGKQCANLRHQIIGIADGQRRAAGNGLARRLGKVPG